MATLKARDELAQMLGCEPGLLALGRGPFEGYRGAQADYLRGGRPAGTVLVGGVSGSMFRRERGRRVTVQSGREQRRFIIRSSDTVAW